MLVGVIEDRPGAMRGLSHHISVHGGNIIGDFAKVSDSMGVINFHFEVPAEGLQGIIQGLPEVRRREEFQYLECFETPKRLKAAERSLSTLRFTSPDKAGLMAELSDVLYDYRADIVAHLGERHRLPNGELECAHYFVLARPERLDPTGTGLLMELVALGQRWDFHPQLEDSTHPSAYVELFALSRFSGGS